MLLYCCFQREILDSRGTLLYIKLGYCLCLLILFSHSFSYCNCHAYSYSIKVQLKSIQWFWCLLMCCIVTCNKYVQSLKPAHAYLHSLTPGIQFRLAYLTVVYWFPCSKWVVIHSVWYFAVHICVIFFVEFWTGNSQWQPQSTPLQTFQITKHA